MIKIIKIIFILTFLYITGCSSSTYEIEEVEEPVEITQTSSGDSALSVNAETEIKDNLKQDIKKESKFNDKQIVSKVYSIQLGAFNFESNASNFTKKAKSLVNQEIYYKNVEGLYKVRLGNFEALSDAVNLLSQLKNLGFNDCFIVELTYIQTLDK